MNFENPAGEFGAITAPPKSTSRDLGWNAATEELPNGVKLTVTTSDPGQVPKLKAFGFMGIMVEGAHHSPII